MLKWAMVRDVVVANRMRWPRPKKFDSMHCSIYEKELKVYKDDWVLIKKSFKRRLA